MDYIVKELGISSKNIFCTASPNLFTVVVHTSWLKKWMKNVEVDNSVNHVDFTLQPGESVQKPWRKIFIRVLNKKLSKVLPLPRYKLIESNSEIPFSFAQLLQYVSQNNHRNLWKDAYKKCNHNNNSSKESAIVNLVDHDQLLTEVILRLYGCNIIKIRADSSGKFTEFKEIVPSRYVSRTYETHPNLLAALFTLETDNNYYIVYRGHYENNLLDCLNFSPNTIDTSYSRGLFIVYQLLNAVKALSDRGLSIGNLMLHDIYLSENLWLQLLPIAANNVHSLDPSLICEQNRSKQAVCTSTSSVHSSPVKRKEESSWRNEAVELERLCNLWIRGRISNLDYLLHLNVLAGRSANDPQAHFLVPWVTDFALRCGRNWRDLSKSKYRLNKGDRQLDLTFDVMNCLDQIPHHVSDALTDITCYVYLARRTPKDVLCKYVRSKWVPAEYPASIQRMQQWTPDECIPEFYTDPTVFKSVHEDLPDLGIPTWATCVEDFITKHREALESSHVSENLHHWIDITFGYKLSGAASVKAKNVCLSLVDGHSHMRRGGTVQVLRAPHPPRLTRPSLHAPPTLLPMYTKKSPKQNDSSEDASEEEEDSSSLPQHVSRLNIPSQRMRSRHKSSSRARSLSKHHPPQEETPVESRASSHSRHYRVQKSELGKNIIYLPKEFNFVSSIQALETLDNFKTKCFFSKSEDRDKAKDEAPVNLFPLINDENDRTKSIKDSEDTAFTNHMFVASYEQRGLKKFTQDAHLEQALKERKNRSLNKRYITDASVYKQFVTECRKQDMLVVGCLIVEIFLHNYMRPLRTNENNFIGRFNNCRTVLKYNFHALPKCVSYVASLLLQVQPPCLNYKMEPTQNKEDPLKKIIVTDKGLPPPTPSQLLQPLLMQHLIPFPQNFHVLFKLLSTLHEYELTSNELHILYSYECDGVHCGKYENLDKTKLNFTLKIAEGKIQTCINLLEVILNHVSNSQFQVMDIFLTHYIELLKNKDTSVLAAWYLFDTVSKNLGPVESRRKLLEHILNLYDDDVYVMDKPNKVDAESVSSLNANNKHKFVKLYHHIFLLQLMVRFGLQCFLDNFTQHLVEAVGGYKDVTTEAGSPGHFCYNRSMANKKPRYSDDNVKNVLNNTSDLFSPDTSYGSENLITPNFDKNKEVIETLKDKDVDNRSENELFHFENDKERLPSRSSRSKSPAESIDSYTLSTGAPESNLTPSPANEVFTPIDTSPNINRSSVAKELNLVVTNDESPVNEPPNRGPMSPSIEIPKKSLFTSYLHFADDDSKDNETQDNSKVNNTNNPKSTNDDEASISSSESCKISDMSSESLFWLGHRLGPVLTCRYVTRNLLKMLSLCYIGKENLAPYDGDDKDEFDELSIANSRVVGDQNAMKVIKCLTSIAAMYGEQVIIFQYLPHMGELIASCRKRLSAPLEGGVIACLQLVKYLLPHMCDAKVMEQLQDTFLKTILQPALRVASTSRCAYPSGSPARRALARKLLDALFALALRIGPEMTRVHLCVPPLQRFFLAFDKASGKTDNWPKQDESNSEKSAEQDSSDQKPEGFLELCRDGSTAEWTVRDGRVLRADLPDLACTPPDVSEQTDTTRLTAQEELLMVFNEELAHQIYGAFVRYIGADATERCLKNPDTVRALCRSYQNKFATSSPVNINLDNRFHSSFSDDQLQKSVTMDHISGSNSFGSNVTLVGNRIDVASDARPGLFDAVSYKMDNGLKNSRHLRGDWLIYWEHEIGRPDKETRFNLKQIKLQTFVGHTQTVKSIYCLDNEGSFMSGSKDKTVRLWSLRNQGDGNATTQCNWSYTGHKKGVLSLSFLESQRLAVSTDSVVHIWDPFMETVVSQLDNIKSPISIVRALPGPSPVLMAATTEATLKVIDARAAAATHDLKLPTNATTFIRCVAVCSSGVWVACGLASGHVAVVDTRTGLPLAQWRAHDGEVLRLAVVDEHRVLSSGLDQVTALWRVDDGELVAHLKGPTEPVHCLSVYYNELISGTTNNRIGVHTSLCSDASFSSTKLRSDTFKGVLTCMSVLPLNRLLLLGSDNGTISLLC